MLSGTKTRKDKNSSGNKERKAEESRITFPRIMKGEVKVITFQQLPSRVSALCSAFERTLYIYIRVAAGEPLLGALFGFARAFNINLRGTLGGLGKDGHFIRQHFRKSPSDSEILFFPAVSISDFARLRVR